MSAADSHFWIVWSSATAPISRYPNVQFIDTDGRSVTVRLYEEFRRNHMFLSGGEFVYPIDLPAGRYTVLAGTEPTHDRRVRISKWYDVCSAVVRFDRAAGRPGQLAVSLVEVASKDCPRPTDSNPVEGRVETVGMAVAGPRAAEYPQSTDIACPDVERAQQHRSVRQMVTKGQVPEGSAEATIFSHPVGADPHGPLAMYASPDYFESVSAWGPAA
jgi:hypothetical protein